MHSYHDCHPDKKKRAEQLCADVQLYNGPLAVVARGSGGRMVEKPAGAAGAEQNGRKQKPCGVFERGVRHQKSAEAHQNSLLQ